MSTLYLLSEGATILRSAHGRYLTNVGDRSIISHRIDRDDRANEFRETCKEPRHCTGLSIGRVYVQVNFKWLPLFSLTTRSRRVVNKRL